MSEINTGGHAFPTDAYYNEKRHGVYDGMSLRDYFAAKALQGIVTAFTDDKARQMVVDNARDLGVAPKDRVALAAYEYADAMLKARDK